MTHRANFEQFFTPELARHLETDPDMLNGREVTITLLFADVRGYSAVSEHLDGSVRRMDVLEVLSDCVQKEAGVLLEYIGDEVMAMWGAPRPQEDHAERAVRAALLMQRRLPVVDAKWAERVGGPVRVGVGIHTGKAWVGKVGTSFKFKYGPQGHTVNLASRVQGATKYLRTPVLVTGATRARLSAEIACRQLTSVRVRNINQPVELFEIPAEQPADYAKLCAGYNAAANRRRRADGDSVVGTAVV